MARGLQNSIMVLFVVTMAAGLGWNRAQNEDTFMSTEEKAFKGYETDNAITFRYGQSHKGSGPEAFNGSASWPRLSIEISFEEGQEEVVGRMIENLLKTTGVIAGECPGCGVPRIKSRYCDECKEKGLADEA